MARKERRLGPDLLGSGQYPTYALFSQYHRYRMEQRPGFGYWDEKLQALIEREGNGRGVRLDDPRAWGAFYTYFGEPIRNVFWAAWEDAFGLQALYRQAEAYLEQVREAGSAPLHVAHPEASNQDGPELWSAIADKIFAELGDGDESDSWRMPSPESLVPSANKKPPDDSGGAVSCGKVLYGKLKIDQPAMAASKAALKSFS